MGKIERIQVSPEDRERLCELVKDRNTPQKIVWRSQIVLLAGEGFGAVEVATRVGKSVLTVRRWRRRYAAKGVDGLLKDATRPPGRKPLTARKIKQVVHLTLNEKPPDATHWSERTMAARAGVAPSSVHKIWTAHGLKPHLTISRDPTFVAKVEHIASTSIRPTRPWCWRSMKRAKSRPLTAPSRGCR
jgi:transposase